MPRSRTWPRWDSVGAMERAIPDDDFVASRTTEHRLRDGRQVRLRPIVPGDKQALAEGLQRLSPESRYRRFMGPVDHLSPEQLHYLTEIDYHDHYAIVAVAADDPGEAGVGVARYVRLADEPTAAEAAVAVVDDYHGQGLGTLLLDALGAAALEHGVERFRAYFLAENAPIRSILESTGARFFAIDGDPAAEIDLPARAEALGNEPMYQLLRAAARGEVGGWRSMMPGWLQRHLPG